MSKKHYSQKEKKKLYQKLGAVAAVVVLILAASAVLFKVIDENEVTVKAEGAEDTLPFGMVEINGVKCVPKNNIRTYLFMGLDSRGEAHEVEEYDGTGQCDVLEVVVLDKTAGTYTRLPINRDTMTDVKSLDEYGTYLATTKVQISLAHANGDGMEISCLNTVDAVSNLLYGQRIDGYASLNMDSIQVLNHLAGGVTVTIEDDFSQSDPSLVEGETVTLTDEQAMHYVHDRMNVGDGTNEGRMRRQSAYLAGLKPLLLEKYQEDNEYALSLFDELSAYMVTNLSRNDFINLAGMLAESEEQEPLKIEGTNAIGKLEFNEFTVDEDSLADVVIQLFYDTVEE